MQGIPEIQDVSNDLEIKSPKVNLVIDRDKAAAVGLNATQIENVLATGFGPKWSSTIYGDATQYPRAHRSRSRSTSNTPTRSTSCRSRRRAARSCRSQTVVAREGNRRPAEREPLGAAAVRVCVVRPAARRLARRGRRSHPPRGRRDAAGDGVDRVRGFGEGLSGVDEEPRPAALRRHRRRLHRARRAVRKLHPPDHDSFGPAVRRSGRARDAVAVRQRAEHLFVRRPDHAHRHREEERDHADRLRARCRAPARHDARRSDPRRLPHPLPADHDDDDVRAASARCRLPSASGRAARRGGRWAWRSSAA